ncbi:MFS transporter, partial [Kitasatospora sp. NPDC093558]|uniref:MFS transporter n=1 Tax=Kitasatospora sp. NPDC093558 TaxID=3155201 RepID=UPI0034318507
MSATQPTILINRTSPANEAPRYRWVVLGVATFTQAATCFFVQGIGALSLVLRHALGLGATQLGLLLSASQLVPLIGLLVTGELLDRYNERWVVGIGSCVVAAGLGLGALAPGYAWLMAAMLLVGAGYSTVQPGGSKSVAGWFGPSQRGLAMGVRQAGLPLGGALAAAVLPVLAGAVGWRPTLVTGALTALAGAVVFMAVYRRPPGEDAPRMNRTNRTNRTDGAASRVGGKALAARFGLLREPAITRLLVSGMCLVSVHTGVTMLAVLYLN